MLTTKAALIEIQISLFVFTSNKVHIQMYLQCVALVIHFLIHREITGRAARTYGDDMM